MSWDPQQYERFTDFRMRPFFDLVARIDTDDPETIVDVGCGNGLVTLQLAAAWPGARVTGIDIDEVMLNRAREHDIDHEITWVNASARSWDPAEPCDIIISSAMLQWVPDHLELLPRWVGALNPGGWLAIQVPDNFNAPSHALMREVAAASRWSDQLLPRLRHDDAVHTPAEYAAVLGEAGCLVDTWETTYLHFLDPAGKAEDPVLDWVRGSGLRPLLGVLPHPDEEKFVAEYAAALREAYPRTPLGVPFPFKRIFAVARRK